MFRCIVLGLLRSGAARHGYALMKEYRDRSGIRIGTGSFYRELRRLLGEGLVRVATSANGGDPRRAPYEITAAGAAVFDAWLAEPASRMTRSHDDELSARVLFIAGTDEPLVGKILESWQHELWFQGKVLERARQAALDGAERSTSVSFDVLPLLLSRRLRHVAADLEFLTELQATYQTWGASRRPPLRVTAAVRRRRHAVLKPAEARLRRS